MKTTYNGKRYNSDKCETIAHRDHYNNGNYAGTTSIERASDGTLLILCDSNGQDCYFNNEFYVPEEPIDFDGYDMDELEEAACVKYGYIKVIE